MAGVLIAFFQFFSYLGLVDDATLCPERVAVILVEGRAEHSHLHAVPRSLECGCGSRNSTADNK